MQNTDNHLPRGMAHHSAKLTDEDVRKIRELAEQKLNHRAIGKRFGISQPCVSDIVRRRAWAHVEER